jgi:putative hemolysin
MKWIPVLAAILILLTSCSAPRPQATASPIAILPPDPTRVATFYPAGAPSSTAANMPNPASTFCEEQGNRLEIRTAADGNQNGVCIFPDGSECDEWTYFRGECGPSILAVSPSALKALHTAMPIDPADYQGWWIYTHHDYNFSIMLPDGWIVNEVTSNDPLMNGHMLTLGGQVATGGTESIRMTFRRTGEAIPLWPTGVGPGEFIEQGTLDVAGEPVRRVLLVCPSLTNPDGEVTSIWYQGAEEGQPNIVRGNLEFGFIFHTESHCEPGYSLTGKVQRLGEMIIASLRIR